MPLSNNTNTGMKMLAKNKPVEEIAEFTELPEAEIRKLK